MSDYSAIETALEDILRGRYESIGQVLDQVQKLLDTIKYNARLEQSKPPAAPSNEEIA